MSASDASIPLSAKPSLGQLAGYFLRLGTLGFGGPIVLVGHMQRDLVEDRKWISPQDYSEGLAFAQLCPGPLAAQLAQYLGWSQSGILGATVAGAAFVAPSFLMVLALAVAYVHYGRLPWIQGAFYGIGAAVTAIIVQSAWKLMRKTLAQDALLWTLFSIVAVVTVWTGTEILWLFVLSGFAAMFLKAPPRWLPPAASLLGWNPLFVTGLLGPASL